MVPCTVRYRRAVVAGAAVVALLGCTAGSTEGEAAAPRAPVEMPEEVFRAGYVEGWSRAGNALPATDTGYEPSDAVAMSMVVELRAAPGVSWPDALTAALRSGALRRDFRRQMRAYGLSPDDLIDVSAAHRAVHLAIASGEPLTQAKLMRLRDELAPVWEQRLHRSPLSAAERQRLGERLVLEAALRGAEYMWLHHTRDAAGLWRYRAHAASVASGLKAR